jgi:hypothetical protein
MPIAVTTLTDPTGTDWILDGSNGVWEMVGKKGFHANTFVHYRDESPALNGAFWRGVRTTMRDLFLPILFRGTDRNVVLAQRRALIKAISPHNGLCTITSAWPDGTVRSIACRYVDGMEAGSQGPGEWGVTAISYGLHFVADDPYMLSTPVVTTWSLIASSRPELPVPGSDTFFEAVTAPLLTSSITGAALNANTDFEAGVSGYTLAGGSFSQDLTFFSGGFASGKYTPDGTTSVGEVIADQVAVIGLAPYKVVGTLACQTARSVQLRIDWYDAAHVYISTAVQSFSLIVSTWTLCSAVFVAPANAGFASAIVAMVSTPPNTDILNIDDFSIAQTGGNSLNNPADIDSYPVWVLTGPFQSIVAINSTSGKSFTINYSAVGGQVLTLDTTPGNTSLVDLYGNNKWYTLVAGYQLWPVTPGDNSFNVVINGATSASGAQLTFTPRYESD